MTASHRGFRHRALPWLLVMPQLAVTAVFFLWPAGKALWYSLQDIDPFGLVGGFAGLKISAACLPIPAIWRPLAPR